MIAKFRGPHFFLSTFFISPFQWAGQMWPSAEHAYQAMKTEDPRWQERIRTAKTSQEAKKLGRMAPQCMWEHEKCLDMYTILKAKFAPGSLLAEKLQATGTQKLVEGNWWGETFWGQCPVGYGENWLGKLLMKVREDLNGQGMNRTE